MRDGCNLTIPITVTWTGDGAAEVLFDLQVGYAGRSPGAFEGLELTIVPRP